MKTVTTAQLRSRLSMLQGRPRVIVSGNLATPWKAVEALDHAVPTYILNILNGAEGIPTREGVIAETCFVGAGQRHHPTLSYVPCRLSMVPVLLRRRLRPDVVIVHCAPARDGYLSMGVEVNILPAAIETVRAHGGLVIAVINEHMPYTFGDALLAESDVDLAVEVHEPLPVALAKDPDDASALIGATVAAQVPDGSTLQTRGSAVRPTSSSVRCTPPADTRSSRCAPGTPRRTCRPSSPASRTRRRASSRVRS